ncbi:MAG: hypothetical protein ACM3PU_08105 [Gemmatimonadota bacterium]
MWKPRDVRKVIAQLAGVALGFAGLSMILEELRATGMVDLGRSLSAGMLSRGTLGLLLLCLSLLLLALPVLWGARPIRGLHDPSPPYRLVPTSTLIRRTVLFTALALALSLLLLFGGEEIAINGGQRTGNFLQLLGIVIGVLSAAMIVFLGFTWADSAGPRRSGADEDEPES